LPRALSCATQFPYTTLFRSIRFAVKPVQEEVAAFVKSQLTQNGNLHILMTGNRQLESALVEKISSRAAGECGGYHSASIETSRIDRKSTRLNSSHVATSYAV